MYNSEKAYRRNEFDLCRTVHESEASNLKWPLNPAAENPVQPDHKFEVTMEPSTFTEEKYALFANYERCVHNKSASSITRSNFRRFLCSSPLTNLPRGSRGETLGSVHQCYRLDGRLIAIGVLDLLPQCVSTVYFIYHEDVNKHNFGKLGALREAALAIEDGYKYYYMGFYIHSCIKMRYKGDYKPQYVLGRIARAISAIQLKNENFLIPHLPDPESYTWDMLDDDLRKRLDARKYVSLSRERRLGISAEPSSSLAADNIGNTEENTQNQSSPVISLLRPSSSPESLFEMNMPGVMSLEEVQIQIDLDKMRISFGKNGIAEMEDLVGWNDHTLLEPHTPKGLFGEFAAVLGPEVARETVVGWNERE
ncbi:MAG: Arginyl-tRNA--protein transferase 1 [Pycnora praestabilis]|nr:MAG: Arginyl-tRNA--protein transferase 1 [Pycnora praestabilis]